MITYTVTIGGTVIINGTPISLNTKNDLLIAKQYIDQALRSLAQQNGGKSLIESEHRRTEKVNKPGAGNTTRDYILRALSDSPGGLYAKDIVDTMTALGWTTSSKKPARFIQMTMYGHKDQFVHLKSGKWARIPEPEDQLALMDETKKNLP